MVVFDLHVEERKGWVILAVVGELDLATAPRVRQAVIDAAYRTGLGASDLGPGARLVLDLSGVDFIDSSGLGVILGALKRVRAAGGELRVVLTESAPRSLFALTGLDQIIPLATSVAEAMAGLGERASREG